MKRGLLLLLLAGILLLCACSHVSTTEITVLVEDGENYTVDVPLVTLEPGGNAYFYIKTEQDYAVTATDYRGAYTLTETRGMTKLELTDVRTPTRVRLTLSMDYRTVHYEANGGDALTGYGRRVSETYSVVDHTRPNVSIGTDLFEREGFTLTGWNTEPDGSGQAVGLGSRMTVEREATLYAQWAAWTEAAAFAWELDEDGSAVITACTASDATVVVPETLEGHTVTTIAARAFENSPADKVILPKTIVSVERKAFIGAEIRELCFFDNIEYITDASFLNCRNLATLRISAIEEPYGYSFRRESVWVDKLDLLINTMGEDRLIFYGGCSMWYNLIGSDMNEAFGERYRIVNMAVNGLASSLLQMEIWRCFLTEHDVLIHTPEIASAQQYLQETALKKVDDRLWAALEYNYDLVSLVDIRVFDGGVLESLRLWFDKKKPGGTYADVYRDSKGNLFWDEYGCLPFIRETRADSLSDNVALRPSYLEDLSRLEEEYRLISEVGVPIFVSFACIDIDQVPAEQQGNMELMGELFVEKFSALDGVTAVFGSIEDFIYYDNEFYDTVYHLLTAPAKQCTATWIRDLKPALIEAGLWEE